MDMMFEFEPLQDNHLDLLITWFNKQHVKEWWNDNLTDIDIKAKYRARIGSSTIFPFIAFLGNKPIGFIQYYYANKIEDATWSNESDKAIGIDQFIGEESYIGRGYGTQMLGQFINQIFSDEKIIKIIKIIIQVDKNNHRAIRCYEKLGFYTSHEEQSSNGATLIMSKYRNTNTEPPG